MSRFLGSELVGRGVQLRDIRLGKAADVLLDSSGRRVLALEVLCGDGNRRVLPFPAAEIWPDRVAVESALVLMDDGLYRARCLSLRELRGAPLPAGEKIEDIVLDGDGHVLAVVVKTTGGLRELPGGTELLAVEPRARAI